MSAWQSRFQSLRRVPAYGMEGGGKRFQVAAAIQEENAKDSLNAVQAAKALGCRRFVFTGSQAEYGVHDALMNEETGCRPTSPTGGEA